MQPNLRRLPLKGAIIILLLAGGPNPYPFIGAIPVPPGCHRLKGPPDGFATWLRHLPLKKDRTVYLFNGLQKENQKAQFAVLDISVGKKDLQQCADAVMRLRAEFLFADRRDRDIDFYTGEGVRLNLLDWEQGRKARLKGGRLIPSIERPEPGPSCTRHCFDEYLDLVFSCCGTQSLEKQLVIVRPMDSMRVGDVFIKGGSPGHAMIVADMAEDDAGHRYFLLAQSYMPAQDIHLVVDPAEPSLSPWFRLDSRSKVILTPEWIFYPNQLRTWPTTGR